MSEEKEYSELEEKVLQKGYRDFRDDIEVASKALNEVFRKYQIGNMHGIFDVIKLRGETQYGGVISIPDNKELTSLNTVILARFMKDLDEMKTKINGLEL